MVIRIKFKSAHDVKMFPQYNWAENVNASDSWTLCEHQPELFKLNKDSV